MADDNQPEALEPPEIKYVALQHLRWGEDTLQPGDAVPSLEAGRDYHTMLKTNQIGLDNAPELHAYKDARILELEQAVLDLQEQFETVNPELLTDDEIGTLEDLPEYKELQARVGQLEQKIDVAYKVMMPEQRGRVDHEMSELSSAAHSPATLADEFPGKTALAEAGYSTLESIKGLTETELTGIKGIGTKTAVAILEILNENTTGG